VVLVSCFYPYRNRKYINHCFALLSPITGSQPGDQDKRHASSAPKRQTRSSVRQEGKSNPRKLTPSSNTPAVSKTQEQGRKDTPSRSEVSSSFKTQQTGQGRRPKAEFKVHSDLVRRSNQTSGSQRPGQQRQLNTTNHFILLQLGLEMLFGDLLWCVCLLLSCFGYHLKMIFFLVECIVLLAWGWRV
jgi:hypothetical protein